VSPIQGRRGKVVIVDDEPDVLESTAMIVRALGYTPVTVDDPSLVVDVVEREQPGLLLQDLRMPGLNLAGLVAALRLNPKTADVPLVFFSAHADVAATASRHDAWGYLAKPFSPQELERLLQRVFATHEEAPAAQALPKDLSRDVRAMFHEQWNLIQALNNYVSVLRAARGGDQALRAIHGIEEVLLKLQSRTDHLQGYLLGVAASLEPAVAPRPEAKASGAEARRASTRAAGPGQLPA